MYVAEHRTHAQGLPDLLLYDALIDDGILLQQDGSLLAAWSFRGPDMASATHAEMAALSARLNGILRLGNGWMVQCDAIRSLAPGYPERGTFPDTATRVIDDERRQQFMAEGAHYESTYFLALTYLPPLENEEKLAGWVFDGKKDRTGTATRAVARFKAKVAAFEDTFKCLFVAERLRRVEFDEEGFPNVRDRLLRYLRRCVTGEDHPFALPTIPVFLNDVIGSQDFRGGIEPVIGKHHLRVIAIDGFPRTSYPGVLGALDTLPIQYRWNTRAILMDTQACYVQQVSLFARHFNKSPIELGPDEIRSYQVYLTNEKKPSAARTCAVGGRFPVQQDGPGRLPRALD